MLSTWALMVDSLSPDCLSACSKPSRIGWFASCIAWTRCSYVWTSSAPLMEPLSFSFPLFLSQVSSGCQDRLAILVFKRFLGGRVGFGVAWPQHALAIVQPLEILPAPLWMHLAPRLALDPAGDFGAGPRATIGWRLLEGLVESGLLLWREEERAARI